MKELLKEALADAATRSAAIADLSALVEAEIASKRGATGALIKTGYTAIERIKPGFVARAVARNLPAFVDAIEPLWAEHRGAGGGDFGAFLVARADRTADALLGVTDARAAAVNDESMKRVYDKLRPNAKKHVIDALPRLGKIIDKHAVN